MPTTTTDPADRAARDRVVSSRDANLWVEAGAGTGKTTLLVSRILALVADPDRPVRLGRLAAITFTEKAAGELKVKVRQALERAAQDATGAARETLALALRELETAAIGTLHGFARLLLTELPVEAGIDPQARVLDAPDYDRLLAEAYDRWFDAAIHADPPPPALRWCLEQKEIYRRRDDRDWLWSLVRKLDQDADLLLDAPRPPAYSPAADLPDLRALAAEAKAHALANCADAGDLGCVKVLNFADALDLLPDAGGDEALYAALESLPWPDRVGGSKRKWTGDEFETNKAYRKRLRETGGAINARRHDPWVWEVFELARGFVREFAAEKRRRGVLGFQDLLCRAVQMLRDSEAARVHFARRFDALLIDEFQDTDPLQVEIAFFLAALDPRVADLQSVTLAPGKLVVVGDPKQSIYRFRRADIEVYENTKARLLAGGEPETIAVNFRSAPAIVDLVNRVFPPLMTYNPDLPASPNYVPLHVGRDLFPPAAGAILLTSDATFAKAEHTRRAEFAHVARWLRDAHAAGLPVYDRRERALRPMRWRDVAILDRRAATFADLEQALRLHDVPFRVEGGKVYYQREEVAAAINGLLAIEDPDDSAALAQWLGSDLVGFSDEDLIAHWLLTDAPPSYRHEPLPPDEIGALLAPMRRLHEARNRVGCLATVRGLFDLAGALPAAYAFPRAEVAVANLQKILDAARAADRDRLSFGQFAREWAAAFQEQREEADSAITEDADDVVRVMTIHRAKGLDWPIVAVIDLAATFRAPGGSPPVLHRRASGRFGVRLAKGVETAGYAALLDENDDFEDAERVRQLYVAMTRAQDYLLLPIYGEVKPRKKGGYSEVGGFMSYLRTAGMVDEQLRVVDPCGAREARMAATDLLLADRPRWDLPESTAAVAPDVAAALAERDRELVLARARPPIDFASPSALVGHLEAAPHGGAGGKRMGLAFHAVMERLDLPARATWSATLAAVAAAFDLAPAERRLIEKWLANFAALPSFALLAHARVWREVPFTWTDAAGASYAGQIDLLADTPDGLLVLDYKTDRAAPADLAAKLDAYRRQGEIYRDAVRDLTGRPDVRMIFCFVDVGEERSLD